MKNSTKIILGVAVVLIGLFVFFRMTGNAVSDPGMYEDFAQCVTNSGAAMYGAYWCPHCQDQKEMFGSSWGLINYVECDPRGDGARPELCEQNGITGYPTWIFGNGERASGTLPLSTIASRTGCYLP
jgi:hypothetical protein